jgi:hypothetical protein
MARRIEFDLDLSKINKSKIKNGDKGQKYYKVTAIERIDDKYGNNWMVVEKQTKEEYEAKEKGTILGNGKNFGWGESSGSSSQPSSSTNVSSDDLPF